MAMIDTNPRAWAKLRASIAAVQLGGPCGYCHAPVLASQIWELDHAIPRAHGGSDDPANLRIVHRLCNRRAGIKLVRNGGLRPRETHMREW